MCHVGRLRGRGSSSSFGRKIVISPLAALRLSQGLSQRELADLTGLPIDYISQIEQGAHDPSGRQPGGSHEPMRSAAFNLCVCLRMACFAACERRTSSRSSGRSPSNLNSTIVAL